MELTTEQTTPQTAAAASAASRAEIAETLANRIENYRLFSRLLLSPLTEQEIDSLEAMQLEEVARDMADTGLLAEGLNDMGRGLHRRHTGTTRVLGTDFAMCFDGVSSYEGLVAVPYASIFKGSITGERAVLFQEPRAKDLAAYRREHVQADPSLHLPEDHVSFELSFMADLSEKAAIAYASGNRAEVLRLVETSQTFLRENILSWYGEFAELALKILDTRFYRGVVKATHGYLTLDETVLDDLKAALS